jgi:hypothetical protein
MARGQVAAAVACQPVGALAFALLYVSLAVCMYAAVRGNTRFDTWARHVAPRSAVVLACALLAQWLMRVACLLCR